MCVVYLFVFVTLLSKYKVNTVFGHLIYTGSVIVLHHYTVHAIFPTI